MTRGKCLYLVTKISLKVNFITTNAAIYNKKRKRHHPKINITPTPIIIHNSRCSRPSQPPPPLSYIHLWKFSVYCSDFNQENFFLIKYNFQNQKKQKLLLGQHGLEWKGLDFAVCKKHAKNICRQKQVFVVLTLLSFLRKYTHHCLSVRNSLICVVRKRLAGWACC